MDDSTSPSDLRVQIAKRWYPRPLYRLAAEIGVHPANLSGILRERLPLKAEVAERIQTVLQKVGEAADGR